MRCSVCGEKATKEWVNPSNPDNKAPYCDEHYEAISKGYNNFCELKMLIEVTGGKLP